MINVSLKFLMESQCRLLPDGEPMQTPFWWGANADSFLMGSQCRLLSDGEPMQTPFWWEVNADFFLMGSQCRLLSVGEPMQTPEILNVVTVITTANFVPQSCILDILRWSEKNINNYGFNRLTVISSVFRNWKNRVWNLFHNPDLKNEPALLRNIFII